MVFAGENVSSRAMYNLYNVRSNDADIFRIICLHLIGSCYVMVAYVLELAFSVFLILTLIFPFFSFLCTNG